MERKTAIISGLLCVGLFLQAGTESVRGRVHRELRSLYTSEDRSISRRTVTIIQECGGVVENPTSENRPARGPVIIGPLDAWEHIGEVKTVVGVVRYIANNRREVCIGFKNPHQGNCAVLIRREYWNRFPQPPDKLAVLGDTISVTGKIVWYQGDPVMWIADGSAVRIIRKSPSRPYAVGLSQRYYPKAGEGAGGGVSCLVCEKEV